MKAKEVCCKNSPDFRVHGCVPQNRRKYAIRETRICGERKKYDGIKL